VVLGQVHDGVVQARSYLPKSLASNDLPGMTSRRSKPSWTAPRVPPWPWAGSTRTIEPP